MAPSPEAVENFNSAYRQTVRRRARGIMGSTISSCLTPVLPYMAIPAGVGLYSVNKADEARDQLAALEAQGFRARKRDIILGTTQASLEKMIMVPLTLGHDELLLATHGATASFDSAAVAQHAMLMEVPAAAAINGLANMPVDAVNTSMEVQTAGERVADMKAAMAAGTPGTAIVDAGGLHDPNLNAGTLVAAGATATAVEYVTDRPFAYKDNRPVDI